MYPNSTGNMQGLVAVPVGTTAMEETCQGQNGPMEAAAGLTIPIRQA
jgi:hypothetical protein